MTPPGSSCPNGCAPRSARSARRSPTPSGPSSSSPPPKGRWTRSPRCSRTFRPRSSRPPTTAPSPTRRSRPTSCRSTRPSTASPASPTPRPSPAASCWTAPWPTRPAAWTWPISADTQIHAAQFGSRDAISVSVEVLSAAQQAELSFPYAALSNSDDVTIELRGTRGVTTLTFASNATASPGHRGGQRGRRRHRRRGHARTPLPASSCTAAITAAASS